MGRGIKRFVFGILAGGLAYAPSVFAQDSTKNQTDQKSAKQATKQKAKSDKDLFKELDSQYKKWLNEDVVYIISPEERSAFVHLTTNEEREQFIEQFWQRRNPDPGFGREHLQRRTLPAHCIHQRALCLRHPGMENGPRTDLHNVGSAR